MFPLQDFAEQSRAWLIAGPAERAAYQLTLMDRRSADVPSLSGTNRELTVLRRLNTALDRSLLELSHLSEPDLQALRAPLLVQVDRILQVLDGMQTSPRSDPIPYAALLAKFQQLRGLLAADTLTSGQLAALAGRGLTADTALLGPKAPANHPFPLTGRHGALACTACHGANMEKILVNQCAACHESIRPANHYQGDCGKCHTPEGFSGGKLDHTAFDSSDCISCHLKDRPDAHFDGQCSLCHTQPGAAWLPAKFDHAASPQAKCDTCHAKDRPADHFAGQCSSCHLQAGAAWLPAKFDHAADPQAKCDTCHEKDRPANHYAGQCSSCHLQAGIAWLPAKFDHAAARATDCAACHAKDRPANHFAGQCSSCHTAGTTWKQARFNHQAAGAVNCISCHARQAPANHYSYQCSLCHTAGVPWRQTHFNHTFNMNHGGAAGNCQVCHPSGPPATDCVTCHKARGEDGGGDD